jgi:hypothetical protein
MTRRRKACVQVGQLGAFRPAELALPAFGDLRDPVFAELAAALALDEGQQPAAQQV